MRLECRREKKYFGPHRLRREDRDSSRQSELARAVVVDGLTGDGGMDFEAIQFKIVNYIMCGIIGYVGKNLASPILLEGLRRLEYRGYDSAGVAVLDDDGTGRAQEKGQIDEGIARLLKAEPVAGSLGIAHTRWATHGIPSDKNSHPHLDQSGKIAVVHNGVIENYDALKQRLLKPDTNLTRTPTRKCWRI